jgi:hypothetical protein
MPGKRGRSGVRQSRGPHPGRRGRWSTPSRRGSGRRRPNHGRPWTRRWTPAPPPSDGSLAARVPHRAFGPGRVVGAVREERRHRLGALRRDDAVGAFAQHAVGLVLLEEVGRVDHHARNPGAAHRRRRASRPRGPRGCRRRRNQG